jgi:putative ABC transport system ATP-binding protein/lipoprotein-releasing system ATP-binding protein
MGFIFQGYFLLPELTALENVSLPGMIGGKCARDRAEESLTAVGLAGRMQHLPAELSGGEQQRVAIARALTNNPEIIFADEPTGNLDSKTGDAIIDLLLDLTRSRKQTLLVVTHDARLAARGDRQLHIKDGVLQREALTR